MLYFCTYKVSLCKMDDVKVEVKQILTQYLEQNNMRKTVERFAVLEAAYSFGTFFTIEELNDILERKSFPVSRATLYNSLKLFQMLQLVVCHRLNDGTKYEATYIRHSNCHQICTMCGKVSDVDSRKIAEAVENTRFKRFRRESFSLYVYGLCSSCQAKMTRESNRKSKEKVANKKNKHNKK